MSMPTLAVKRCKHCGEVIRGKAPQAVYCTVRCRNEAQIKRRRGADWHGAERVGRFQVRLYCWNADCLREFRSRRGDAQYCSSRCRVAEWRRTRHSWWQHS